MQRAWHSLSGNQLCDVDAFGRGSFTTAGLTKLCEALVLPECALVTLNLRSNQLRAEGGKLIATALKTNTSLTSLDLSANTLRAEGGSAIAGMLKDNTSLRQLRCVHSHVL